MAAIVAATKDRPRRESPWCEVCGMLAQGYGPMGGQLNGPMQGWNMPYAQQPPIIVVAGPQGFGNALQPAPANVPWFPQDAPARTFTVVGERENLSRIGEVTAAERPLRGDRLSCLVTP